MKKKITFIIILLLSGTYFISQFYRVSLGVVAIDITNDLHLNSEELGRVGGMFFLSFALAQIPLGILLDTYNPFKIMIIMLLVIFLGTMLLSISDNLNFLMIARSLQGIGCGVCLMGPLVIIAKLSESKYFSYYSGFIMGLGGLGALVATDPFYFIVKNIGWKNAFFQSSFVVLIIILLLLLLFPKNIFYNYKKNKIDFNLRAYRKIIVNRNFLLMLPMSMFGYASFAFILTLWGSRYLHIVQDLSNDYASFILMFMAFFWTIGSVAFGYIEKILKRKKLIIITSSFIVCFLLILLSININYSKSILLTIFSLFGFFGAYTLVVISHYRILFKENIIGKVLTTSNLFNFSGVFLVQWITGLIIFNTSEKLNLSNNLSFSSAFLLIALLLFLSIYFYSKTNEK